MDRYSDLCIVDEVQYAPDILPYIKMRMDMHRAKTGVFFLIESEFFPLMQSLSKILAIRSAVFEILGLSGSEYLVGSADGSGLFQCCFAGAYFDSIDFESLECARSIDGGTSWNITIRLRI